MVEIICTRCGGKLTIAEEKVVLDERCAQLAKALVCSYCGTLYTMGDELPLASTLQIEQNLQIEAVEGEMTGISIGPTEDGSQVQIDQRMEVGTVQGTLIGVQVGNPGSGRVDVQQKADTVEGTMIGSTAGAYNSPDQSTVSKITPAKKRPWWQFWKS